MKIALFSLALMTNLSFADQKCVNLTGVFLKPEYPEYKITVLQKGCEAITANSMVTSSVQTLSFDGKLQKANNYCEVQSQYPNYSPARDVYVSAIINERLAQFTCAGILKLKEFHSSALDHAATMITWSLSSNGDLVEHRAYSNGSTGNDNSRAFSQVYKRQ